MPSSKDKTKVAGKPDALPRHFRSLEEAAAFWDKHDSADYEQEMVDVEVEVGIKRRTYLVPIDGKLYRKVQSIARKKGVSTQTLVSRWVQEKAS